MADKLQLNHPCLIAVWPGMGNVALNAGIYLLAKLDMQILAELEASDLFDIEHVEVKEGIIQPGRRPRNRFFLWKDPAERRDLVVFLGEAQPPIYKYPFCRQLITYVKELGVEQVFTFAAMATEMHPKQRSRVFGAATDSAGLDELKRLDLEILDDSHISGLNGVFLGAAAEGELRGACLLGEMPHIFSQLPFPKASLAILEVFTTLTGIEVDFQELEEQAQATEEQLGELLKQVEPSFAQQEVGEEPELPEPAPEPERLRETDRLQIEKMFTQATRDRTKAIELKRELDRLGVFKDYEDRFLDLFTKPGPG